MPDEAGEGAGRWTPALQGLRDLTDAVSLYDLFFFQAEDGIRDLTVTGVQTCALPIWDRACLPGRPARRARARGRLSRRSNAHELHPPPLRLEPRAAARLRRRVRRVARVRAPALAVGVLLAVAPPAAAFSARDMLGREVTLAAPPARIVSLVPSVTEILYALGAEERLVGVTAFCDYPPAARQRPSVGGMVNPNLEASAALKPDPVIAPTDGNREETFP